MLSPSSASPASSVSLTSAPRSPIWLADSPPPTSAASTTPSTANTKTSPPSSAPSGGPRACSALPPSPLEIADHGEDRPDTVSSLNRSRRVEERGVQSVDADSQGRRVREPVFVPATEGPRKIVDVAFPESTAEGNGARDPGATK